MKMDWPRVAALAMGVLLGLGFAGLALCAMTFVTLDPCGEDRGLPVSFTNIVLVGAASAGGWLVQMFDMTWQRVLRSVAVLALANALAWVRVGQVADDRRGDCTWILNPAVPQ